MLPQMLHQRCQLGGWRSEHAQHQGPPAATTRATASGRARPRPGAGRPKKAPEKEVVVGIDLGTTNSAVAYIKNGKPVCIPNSEGDTTTPSVVAVLPESEVVVGKEARKNATLQPETTYYSVKRLIGRQIDDPIVKEEAARLAYKVGQDEAGSVTLACANVEPGYLYPEEVSAQVLAALLADARAHTGCSSITKAVVCVPAYFNDTQRDATTTAGKLAGLETVRLLREPVAAALAYGLDLQQDQTVLVFDLGGGTYDISLLEVGNGTVEVLATGGDAHLGGDDWDAAVVSWLEKGPLAQAARQGLELSSPRVRSNLRALAEAAKISLSDAEQVVLRMPVGGPGGGPLEVTLTRDVMEEITADLWRRARLPLDQACWQAGVDLGEVVGELEVLKQQMRSRGVASWKVDTMQPEIRPRKRGALTTVLLVGGATRMPSVRRFIKNMTSLEPEEGEAIDPDEAVALGAAVQAGILQGEVGDMMIMDQWQASLMRALAKLQLQSSPKARDSMAQRYDLSDAPKDIKGQSAGAAGGADGAAEGEEGASSGSGDEEGDGSTGTSGRATAAAGSGAGSEGDVTNGGGKATPAAMNRAKRRAKARVAAAAAAAAAAAGSGGKGQQGREEGGDEADDE